MSQMQVWPALGYRIRWPDGRVLSVEGGRVPKVRYWLRRLQYGDVVTSDPRPVPSKKTTKKATKAAPKEG